MYLSMFAIDLFLYGCRIHYAVLPLLWEVRMMEMLVLHCICPAETYGDRQTEHKERKED